MCSSGKNVSSSWLNLILGNGPLHPVEMLWYLQYLFMWWPLGPGTAQGEPVKEQWAGRGQELNQLQETSSSSSAYLQRLCRPFPPENVPLSSLNKEMLPHLTSHRNVHWELVCLIHQSIINRKKHENTLWSSDIISQEIILLICSYTCSTIHISLNDSWLWHTRPTKYGHSVSSATLPLL